MDFCELVKERDSVNGAAVFPQSLNGANASTGAIDMSRFNRVIFYGMTGSATPTSVVGASIQQTNNANGSGATNIASYVITNMTNATNQAFSIEINAMQMTARYAVGFIFVNTAANTVSLIPVATDARYHPATTFDDASVNQRVSVLP